MSVRFSVKVHCLNVWPQRGKNSPRPNYWPEPVDNFQIRYWKLSIIYVPRGINQVYEQLTSIILKGRCFLMLVFRLRGRTLDCYVERWIKTHQALITGGRIYHSGQVRDEGDAEPRAVTCFTLWNLDPANVLKIKLWRINFLSRCLCPSLCIIRTSTTWPNWMLEPWTGDEIKVATSFLKRKLWN